MSFSLWDKLRKSNQAKGNDETKYQGRDTLSIYYVLSKVMTAMTISII